jgi:hypothetical protein
MSRINSTSSAALFLALDDEHGPATVSSRALVCSLYYQATKQCEPFITCAPGQLYFDTLDGVLTVGKVVGGSILNKAIDGAGIGSL